MCLKQNCLSCWSGEGVRERSPDFFDPPDRETMRLQKFGKLLAGPNTDLGELANYQGLTHWESYNIYTLYHVQMNFVN